MFNQSPSGCVMAMQRSAASAAGDPLAQFKTVLDELDALLTQAKQESLQLHEQLQRQQQLSAEGKRWLSLPVSLAEKNLRRGTLKFSALLGQALAKIVTLKSATPAPSIPAVEPASFNLIHSI